MSAPSGSPALKTRVCELLDVPAPILQTGMGWVATPQLTAAASNAAAKVGPSRAAACFTVAANPRMIWLRMTPLLPRAPISEPWLTASQIASRSSAGTASISSTTASSVRDMLVPVSPSGTG